MTKFEYDKNLVPDCPPSLTSELHRISEHMLFNFKKLPEGMEKDACMSNIKQISTNLNELRNKELLKELPKI